MPSASESNQDNTNSSGNYSHFELDLGPVRVSPTRRHWCYYYRQNTNAYAMAGLGLSNFLWRMTELLYPPVIRGGGFNTVASTAFQLALPVAAIRGVIDIIKYRHQWRNKPSNQALINEALQIHLKSVWHFYVAYMGWDTAYEGGNLLRTDNPLVHFLKNAAFSGGGYVIGELIAQSLLILAKRAWVYYQEQETNSPQLDNNKKEQLLRPIEQVTRTGPQPENALSMSDLVGFDSWQRCNYFDTSWNYFKSFILFFAFAFFSDGEQHIRDHDNAISTAFYQAMYIAGVLLFCDQLLNIAKTSYDYRYQVNSATHDSEHNDSIMTINEEKESHLSQTSPSLSDCDLNWFSRRVEEGDMHYFSPSPTPPWNG